MTKTVVLRRELGLHPKNQTVPPSDCLITKISPFRQGNQTVHSRNINRTRSLPQFLLGGSFRRGGSYGLSVALVALLCFRFLSGAGSCMGVQFSGRAIPILRGEEE
jgi:hypothetical protein